MKIKLSPPVKLSILFGLGISFLIGSFLVFDKDLPFLKKPSESSPGEIFGLHSQISKDFPEDIPLFEPNTPRSSTKSRGRVHLVLETEESSNKVLQFYQNNLGQTGWESFRSFYPAGGEAWIFSKGNRRLELIVVHNETEGKTLIFLKTDLP